MNYLVFPVLCLTPLLSAGDGANFANYRGFQFGATVAESVKRPGVKFSDARVMQKRPALIQEVDWRPESSYSSAAVTADPVQEGLLRFYNGELFQIITTYDYQKVAGLSEGDIVEAISSTYGPATVKPAGPEIAYHTNYSETAPVLARWETQEFVYDLVRTGDRYSFAFILSSKRLEALAKAAIAESMKQDAIEAPQRALELQKSVDEASRAALAKIRSANKPNFKP